MPTATLPDGRVVSTSSPEWRKHCMDRWLALQPLVDQHVAALKRIQTVGERRRYLEELARTHAEPFVTRVRVDFEAGFQGERKRLLGRRTARHG